MSEQNDRTFEQLTDWLDGRLPQDEAAAVARWVQQADAATQADAEWLRAFQALRKQVVLAAPPARVRSALTNRFVEYKERRAHQQGGFFQRLVGTLSFDSAQQPAMGGARAVDGAHARQLVYATELLDVALNLQPEPRQGVTDLLGQVLPNSATLVTHGIGVQLVSNGREIGLTVCDDLGEFRFAGLPAGVYHLFVTANEQEVEIPAFEVE